MRGCEIGLQGDGGDGANEVNGFKKYLGSKINNFYRYFRDNILWYYVMLFFGKVIFFFKGDFNATIYLELFFQLQLTTIY